jgi:uncharacterized protein (DUF362 family)
MVTRREFLTRTAAAGSALILVPEKGWTNVPTSDYWGLHDFIETHPDAVFIFRTVVESKTNASTIRQVGYDFGRSLFVARGASSSAYSVLGNVAIKPNITSWSWDKTPIEQTMGIQTDPNFVEGIIHSLTDLSIQARNVYIREANYFPAQSDGQWYRDMALRTGIDLKGFATLDQLGAGDVQWTTVQNGVWYQRIPYLWPVNTAGTPLINIAKFKSHSMGMTLCSKNLQGTNARPYVAHCTSWGTSMSGVKSADVAANAYATIKTNYDRHKRTIPRWMTLDGDAGSGSAGGLWQETHASRCLDNNSAIQPLLNIIEGVYGREGPFVSGPEDNGGYGRDMMTNILVFGKNARHVDIVGTYLSGHEPGNFGLFHLALERGLSKYLNPYAIPLYEWKSAGATPASLSSFVRTPIRTIYLPQAGESTYHMVNEGFNYNGVSEQEPGRIISTVPDAFVLYQNFPNPFNPSTSIQYSIPHSGNVRLDICDVQGGVVDVLVDGYVGAGEHLQWWDCSGRASGTYFYRISFDGMTRTKRMTLVR